MFPLQAKKTMLQVDVSFESHSLYSASLGFEVVFILLDPAVAGKEAVVEYSGWKSETKPPKEAVCEGGGDSPW